MTVDPFAVEQLVTAVRADCSDPERVSFELPTPLIVAGNPTLLERALLNLVENAIRHSSGPVHVTLREAAGGLTMLVDDHGRACPRNCGT